MGTVTAMKEERTTSLSVLNFGSHPILLTEMKAISSDPQFSLNFSKQIVAPKAVCERKCTLPDPFAKKESVVARATFTGKAEGHFAGKIQVSTNDTNPVFSKIDIPFKSRMIPGYHTKDRLPLGLIPLAGLSVTSRQMLPFRSTLA